METKSTTAFWRGGPAIQRREGLDARFGKKGKTKKEVFLWRFFPMSTWKFQITRELRGDLVLDRHRESRAAVGAKPEVFTP
jgi:hypothetical protein